MFHSYNNLSIGSITGERWKELPKFQGYYAASNLGRIKSIDRYVPHQRHGMQYVAGRILKQKVIENKNIKTGKPSIDLQVALSMEGVLSYHNVRRLVYAAFRKPELDFKSDDKYIINVNGNGYDCRLTNLKMVTKSRKSQLAFERGRVVDSYLKTADRSLWSKPYGGMARRKPVAIVSSTGKVLKKFASITEASFETGVGEKEIINVCKGLNKQWNGRVWKYLPTNETTIRSKHALKAKL